jgi:hypothetical protein
MVHVPPLPACANFDRVGKGGKHVAHQSKLGAAFARLQGCESFRFIVPDMSKIEDLRRPETPKIEEIHILYADWPNARP